MNRYLAARLMRSSIEVATATAGSPRRRHNRAHRGLWTSVLLVTTALLWFAGRAL